VSCAQFTVVVGVAIAGLTLALVIASILTDPIQTTATGSKIF
jgi:orotate phosphoribosyltransferase